MIVHVLKVCDLVFNGIKSIAHSPHGFYKHEEEMRISRSQVKVTYP